MKKIKLLLAVSILLLAAVGLSGCGKQQAQAETTAADGSEAGGNSGKTKVVVAHTQTYIPYDYINEDGESDGYEVQVLKAVAELLPEYQFEFVGTTDDDLLIGVESGKYDIGVKGVWYTDERAEEYIFPENYIGASSIGIVYRTENADQITDLESFANFSGKLVPIAPQNAQYTIVEQYNESHPDNQIDLIAAEAFELSDAYLWVVEGRYDAYFSIKTSYESNIANEDGAYHEYDELLSYAVYQAIPTWPLFNIENTDLAAAYDTAFEQLLADGTIDELQQEYFGENLFDLVAD